MAAGRRRRARVVEHDVVERTDVERREVLVAAALRRRVGGVEAPRPVAQHAAADVEVGARYAARAHGLAEAPLVAGEHGREEVAVAALEREHRVLVGRVVVVDLQAEGHGGEGRAVVELEHGTGAGGERRRRVQQRRRDGAADGTADGAQQRAAVDVARAQVERACCERQQRELRQPHHIAALRRASSTRAAP